MYSKGSILNTEYCSLSIDFHSFPIIPTLVAVGAWVLEEDAVFCLFTLSICRHRFDTSGKWGPFRKDLSWQLLTKRQLNLLTQIQILCFSIPLHVFRFNFATCFAIVFPFDAKTQDTSELRYERPEFPFHLPLRTFQRNVSASLLGHLSHNGTCSKRRRSGSFGFGWLDPTLCVIPAQEATPSEASQRGASIYEFDACEEGMNIKIIQRAYCITRFLVLKLYNRYYTGKGQWDKHYACTQSARAVPSQKQLDWAHAGSSRADGAYGNLLGSNLLTWSFLALHGRFLCFFDSCNHSIHSALFASNESKWIENMPKLGLRGIWMLLILLYIRLFRTAECNPGGQSWGNLQCEKQQVAGCNGWPCSLLCFNMLNCIAPSRIIPRSLAWAKRCNMEDHSRSHGDRTRRFACFSGCSNKQQICNI